MSFFSKIKEIQWKPTIFNEIPVLITFESDWKKTKLILERIGKNFGDHPTKAAEKKIKKASQKFLIQDQKLDPVVYTKVADSGVLLTIRYLCTPQNRRDSERLDRLFNSLWAHPCFTIGKIQGVALGGGAGLIACLDHVISVPSAKIALSEGKLGILPAVIGPYVYRKVGSAEFRRLSMLAGRIEAEDALRINLINQISESLDGVEDKIIKEVQTTGPMAVAESKRLTLTFDRWSKSDEELRLWTLDKTR